MAFWFWFFLLASLTMKLNVLLLSTTCSLTSAVIMISRESLMLIMFVFLLVLLMLANFVFPFNFSFPMKSFLVCVLLISLSSTAYIDTRFPSADWYNLCKKVLLFSSLKDRYLYIFFTYIIPCFPFNKVVVKFCMMHLCAILLETSPFWGNICRTLIPLQT